MSTLHPWSIRRARLLARRSYRQAERRRQAVEAVAIGIGAAGLLYLLLTLPASSQPFGVVSIDNGGKVDVYGPCRVEPGTLVQYFNGVPTVTVALDCTHVFGNGFEGAE